MAFNWMDATQQQLAGPGGGTGMQALSNMPQLRTGKNPNPKFPRARHAWENVKESGGNAALGGLGGAATGAAIGSMFPVIGTGIGAGLGGAAGILAGLLKPQESKEFAFGTSGGMEQYPTVTPQQQGIMQLLQQLGVYGLQNPYEGFEGIENQARKQFEQQTVPSLAERFTAGTGGAMSSPSFASQLGQAGAGLETDLAAQKAGYGQQNMQQMLQLLQLGLSPQFGNRYEPSSPGAVQNLLGNAGNLYQTYQMQKLMKSLMNKGG